MIRFTFLAVTIAVALYFDQSALSAPISPADDKEEIAAIVKGNNEFAFDLYRQIAKEAKPADNIFFSPISISTGMAILYAGARGETAQEIAKTMHFDPNQETFLKSIKKYNDAAKVPQANSACEFVIANSLWCQETFPFQESFLQLGKTHFDSEQRLVNFKMQSETSRLDINDWVAKKTNKRIPELIKAGQLTPDTRFVIANAVYFKQQWAKEFPLLATKDLQFKSPAKPIQKVPTMHIDRLATS